MARRSNKPRRSVTSYSQVEYQQIRNPYKPLEVLDQDQLEKIHDASMIVLEDVGMQVLDQSTRETLKIAGFDVNHQTNRVRFDRDGVMELIAKAPAVITVRGRDPAKRIVMGEGAMAFTSVGGPAFSSDMLEGRKPGQFEDMVKYLKLVQMLNIIHLEGGGPFEPTDLPAQTRHLDLYLASCLYLDKPWKPQANSRDRAVDALAMARISHATDDQALAADPVFLVNTNTNTPLTFDAEIAQSVTEYARAGQPLCITPFAMAGAMAPATMAGALTMQNAETLAIGALIQAIRPGCPFMFGSFACNADMRTGAPAFGTPEFAKAAQASGQLARRYNLPWRSSNTTTSCAPDAQAAYESQMAIWGSVTGHCSLLNQGAGWLEGGLVGSFEKLMIDAEMLQMIAAWMEPIRVDDDSIGLEAIKEVGPGGHFLGCSHTMERYEDAFYQPLLSDWRNFENWRDDGAKDTAQRAYELVRLMLKDYQQPDMDPGIKEELDAYVAHRKEDITGC